MQKMQPLKIGGYNRPAEIARIWEDNGTMMAKMKTGPTIALAILGGLYISFGCLANIVATSPQGLSSFESIFMRLIGASLFPVGLMFIIFCGGQLFTGNNLMVIALYEKRITIKEMLQNWGLVYVGNLIGCLLLAWAVLQTGVMTGEVAERAIAIATTKANLTIWESFIRGVLCNIMVILACWFQAGAPDMMGKIFAVWFPITLFVFLGFEHSIANMFFIPIGMMLGAKISVGAMLLNLIFVTLGNIVGGAGVVGTVYWYTYLKK